MGVHLRNLLLLVLLSGGALATWLAARGPAEPMAAAPAVETIPRGYHLTGARLSRTDEMGRIVLRVSVDRAEKRSEDGDLEFEDVRVEYVPGANIHWEASAERGIAPADLTSMALQGGVRLVGHTEGSSDPVIVETSALRLEEALAETDAPLSLRRGDLVLDAVGLTVDLHNDHAYLKTNVVARFDP